jgi:hypothetical protein
VGKFWRTQVFIRDFFKPLKDVQIAEEEARESEASDRIQAQIPCNNGAVARLGEAGDICGVFGDSEGCCQDSKSSGEEWQLSMAGSDCGINTAAVESDDQ